MARLNIRPASQPIIAAAISCFTTTQHIEAPGNCLNLQVLSNMLIQARHLHVHGVIFKILILSKPTSYTSVQSIHYE